MCGLVAWIKSSGAVVDSELRGLRDSISHRGPDDSGIYISPDRSVGLGFRRLSIIDLSAAGHQPMSNVQETLWIIFNGEIYNFAEIRFDLEAHGCRFRSRSDTEVILCAYEVWGPACVDKFIGMFAFVIWDSRSKQVFAARDRLGIKPLYYSMRAGQLMLASELKPIVSSQGFDTAIDQDALTSYLGQGYITPPATIFRDVRSLPPGHTLSWRCDSGALSIQAYWQILDHLNPDPEMVRWSEEDWVDALDAMVRSAVKYRLISDVPLGAFLSGGIDSSVVTAIMRQVSNAEVRTFTVGFDDNAFDEAVYAERVARHLGTTHMALRATYREAQDLIRTLPIYFDEPFADSSQIPTLLVSKMTRKHVTVALSGDGGDELFCGYEHYRVANRLEPIWLLPQMLRNGIAATGRFAPRERWRLALQGAGLSDPAAFVKYFNGKWRPQEIRTLAPDLPVDGVVADTRPGASTRLDGHSTQLLSGLMLNDLREYLPADILTKLDRASMAVSLEARVPLLDHRLVELAVKAPLKLKFRQGRTKHLLRQVLYRYVPPELVDRPKMGFGLPLDSWLRSDLKGLIDEYLSPSRLAQGGLFNEGVVGRQVDRFMRGESGHGRVWTLLMFQMWSERYLGT